MIHHSHEICHDSIRAIDRAIETALGAIFYFLWYMVKFFVRTVLGIPKWYGLPKHKVTVEGPWLPEEVVAPFALPDTNNLLLAHICHVFPQVEDTIDGLDKVDTALAPTLTWPFTGCEHRQWGYDSDIGVYRYKTDNCNCIRPRTEIHEWCDQALQSLAQGDLDKTVAFYSRAVQVEPRNGTDARLQAGAFCNLGIFLSSHLTLGHSHTFMKDDHKAVLLFKVGAVALKSPYCMYFYGHALVHGQGGVKENFSLGIQYLSQAGVERVGEAFYELGKIYEGKIYEERRSRDFDCHSVKVDMTSEAAHFYYEARQAYTFKDDNSNLEHEPPMGAWRPSSVTVRSLLDTEGWHAMENSLSYALGQEFSWGIIGQAFLFTGAIQLAKTTENPTTENPSNEFESFLWMLRWMLPTLGIILALRSLSRSVETLFRIGNQRATLRDMVAEKMKAHGAILYASKNDLYYCVQGDNQTDRDAAWRKEVRSYKKHLIYMFHLVFFTNLTLRLTLVADTAFVIIWSFLLNDYVTYSD